jgi:tight adherence protein B
MESLELLSNPFVLAALAGLAVLLLSVGVVWAGRAREETIEARLDRYATRPEDAAIELQKGRSAMDGLEGIVSQRGFAQTLQQDLAQANLKLRVAEFVALTLLVVVLLFLVGQLLFDSLLLALVFGIVGFFIPRLYVNARRRRRLNAFNDQLGDCISLLANSLRAGFGIVQSMETVSNQLSDPIGSEFRRVTQEIGLGLHYEEALNNLLRRVPSDDLDLMITAINIQGRVGGNLAEILDTIGHTIRERVRIKGEIRVLTAQQMFSGYVLTALPLGLGLILYLINKPYMSRLFDEPCGWLMIGVGVLMVAIGFWIIHRIVDIEV